MFTRANLGFSKLIDIDFSEAILNHADLTCAEIVQCKFIDAEMAEIQSICAKFDGGNFTRAYLRGANLEKARIEYVTLDRTNFMAARLIDAALMYCRATEVNFTHASMGNVEIATAFINSDFSNADLSEGSFDRLTIKGCNFRNASFFKTRITMVSFEKCIFGDRNSIMDAIESDR